MYRNEKENNVLNESTQFPKQFVFKGNAEWNEVGDNALYLIDPWHREINGVVYPLTPYTPPSPAEKKRWRPWPSVNIEPYIEEAKTLVAEMGDGTNRARSGTHGEGDMAGMIGEIVYREHLKKIEIPVDHERTSDHDMLVGPNKKTVDVKTKSGGQTGIYGRLFPEFSWDVSVPIGAEGPEFQLTHRTKVLEKALMLKEDLDTFVFVRIEAPSQKKQNEAQLIGKDPHGKSYYFDDRAWIVGQMTQRDFYMNAFPLLADEEDWRPYGMVGPRPYQSKFDQWNVYHHQLEPWWGFENDTTESIVLKDDYLEIICKPNDEFWDPWKYIASDEEREEMEEDLARMMANDK
jgi:hypothetical protein